MPSAPAARIDLVVGNDVVVTWDGWINPGDAPLDGATVTLAIEDEAGAVVVPAQTMTEGAEVTVTRDDGSTVQARRYATTVDASAPFQAGHRYVAVFTATHPSGYDALWRVSDVARENA